MPDVLPPMPPNGTPRAPRKGMPAWAVALLCVGAIVWIVAAMTVATPRWERQPQIACMINLSQLGQVWAMRAQERPGEAGKYSGVALWLSYRKGGGEIRRGDEKSLMCPSDDGVHLPETDEERKRWDDVDLDNPPAGLCSYAARDFVNFPLAKDDSVREPIGACLHHKGGAMVVFSHGDAQWMPLAELGLTSDDEKVVGPASKSPILRVLR